MVEYGIMVALIAVVSIVVIGLLGVDVWGALNAAQNSIATTPGPKSAVP